MIEDLELLGILIVLSAICWRVWRFEISERAKESQELQKPTMPKSKEEGEVRVYKSGLLYCTRPLGHIDLKDFFDTPEFVLYYPDGGIVEGVQNEPRSIQTND